MSYKLPRKFAAIACIFVICLLVSIKIVCAQVHIANAHLTNVHVFSDPCAGQAFGGTCTDGAIYLGTSAGLNPALRYMTTPAGCPNETCSSPTGTDTVTKAWANNSGTSADNVNTGATNSVNGKLNTAILVNYTPFYTDTDAAHWCANMNYGGYTNWYLPSLNEYSNLLFAKVGLGLAGVYWTSTESSTTQAWAVSNITGSQVVPKTAANAVRCIRGY